MSALHCIAIVGRAAYFLVLNVEAPLINPLLNLFAARFFSNKCLKEGSVEDKSPVESPFDWFNDKDFFKK